MSRKKTVKVIYPILKSKIDAKYRSNVVFCEAMEFEKPRDSWVSDLKRNKNLPSPAEAAKMCLLLETTPDVILMHEGETEKDTAKCQEDLALVWEHYEKLKAEKGIKKDPSRMGEVEMTDVQKEAWALIRSWDDEKLKKFIAGAKAMLGD